MSHDAKATFIQHGVDFLGMHLGSIELKQFPILFLDGYCTQSFAVWISGFPSNIQKAPG